MLAPIFELLFYEPNDNYKGRLALTEDQVVISYKTYKSNEPTDMQAIVDQKLAPGKISL